ncbi:polyketide cyclase/dehydrase/lipid transport protein [Herbihabitans rhizosphaerae]|uniref:Polyketide cyclase/dehydrase/lipid transport protein n=1 Tax=Herbihabitans rhizosphaerae TaxID=1872711 RepID=A0A4Q7KMX8_9PSEU|nr:polyketide cyclase/dehydrase/lipid transport protein [Herbihabitans rhizosphaerae]
MRLTMRRSVRADQSRAFDTVVAEDVLPKVLHRFLLIPSVIGTEGNTGPWDVPGSRRRVLFSDGTSAREEVREWVENTRFAYRVDQFDAVLGRLVTHATGEWDFTGAPGGSAFNWTYTFHARHWLLSPLVHLFTHTLWRGYMSRCADRCARLAEAGPEGGA